MISLKFEKIYKYARKQEPCYIALPYKKGRLWNEDSVIIKNFDVCVLSQVKVTSRWEAVRELVEIR